MELIKRSFLAMGTEVTVTLAIAAGQAQCAEAAIAELRALVEQFGRDGWAWGAGALGAFNAALARGGVASVPKSLQPLFAAAWRTRVRSGGCYEPRIAALVKLWGFDCMDHLRNAPPSPDLIATALAALHAAPPYEGGDHYGPAPGIGWDLGGIGKGYIVDCGLGLLQQRGFSNAMLDAGGNLAARGVRSDRPWRAGVRDPRSPAHAPQLLLTIDVADEAVITHGDDQRYFDYAGQRYAHLIDPSSGWPVQGLRALTVIDRDAARADSEGAALFVAGAQRWPALARQLGLSKVLAVADDGSLQMTSALANRAQIFSDAPVTVIA
jgi:FAD:protein FMN transferase